MTARLTLADLNPRNQREVMHQLHGKTNPDRQLPHALPELDQAPALGGTVSGEEKSMERVVVRFTGHRVRPLDPDNFAASTKDLLDGLRHAGLIFGDEPWRISLQTEQVKVRAFKDERTVIEIELT